MTKRKNEENNEKDHKEPIKNKENSEQEGLSEKKNSEADELPSITISYEELNGLQKQIADLKTQSDEYLSGLQRERADFANYKRRVDLEQQSTYQYALADLVKPFLVVIDDLERALKHTPNNEDFKSWISGISLIYQKLIQTIENQGVERLQIKPGDEFDPLRFEAVTHEETPDFENGQVIEVLQSGYKIKDRIIRPALVRVAK